MVSINSSAATALRLLGPSPLAGPTLKKALQQAPAERPTTSLKLADFGTSTEVKVAAQTKGAAASFAANDEPAGARQEGSASRSFEDRLADSQFSEGTKARIRQLLSATRGFEGGDGADRLEGDVRTFSGGAGDDAVIGSELTSRFNGDEGNDLFQGTGIGTFNGGTGDDVLQLANADGKFNRSVIEFSAGDGNDVIVADRYNGIDQGFGIASSASQTSAAGIELTSFDIEGSLEVRFSDVSAGEISTNRDGDNFSVRVGSDSLTFEGFEADSFLTVTFDDDEGTFLLFGDGRLERTENRGPAFAVENAYNTDYWELVRETTSVLA